MERLNKQRDAFEARVRGVAHLVPSKFVATEAMPSNESAGRPKSEINYGPSGQKFDVKWDFEGQWKNK